jgi:transposase
MGKTKDVSTTKKESILALLRSGRHTINEIATQMEVSKRTVQRVKQAGVATSWRTGRCGRKRITSATTDRFICRQALENPQVSSYRLAGNLVSSGVHISKDTVRRRLKEKGVTSVKPVRKPALTAVMRKKRLDWCKRHAHWTVEDWNKVCFSDESTFMCQAASTSLVWHKKGQSTPTLPTVKYPTKVMVWSVMCAKGAGRLHVVEGNMNTDQYCQVLVNHFLPQANEWYPTGGYTFMQDGAPCHTSKRSMQCLASHGIPVLPWPGNSPDLNPIETLWAIVKKRLRTQTFTTKETLIAGIKKLWLQDATLRATCQKLIASMPTRVKAVIAAKGGNTKYYQIFCIFIYI